MKTTLLPLIVIAILFFNTGSAQDRNNQTEQFVEFQNAEDVLLFTGSNDLHTNAIQNFQILDNTIFIEQIGASNQIISTIQAPATALRLQQNGEQNIIELQENSKEILKVISQNGNNNSVIDISSNPNMSTTLEVLQNGNDHYFEKYGTNSLSNSLKIKMTGEAQTILIRSF